MSSRVKNITQPQELACRLAQKGSIEAQKSKAEIERRDYLALVSIAASASHLSKNTLAVQLLNIIARSI